MKQKDIAVEKENFIQFLASSTPEEINQYILQKGKPPKLIEPIVFFDKKEDSSNNTNTDKI